jgi:FkbM family methyltransferase
MTLTLLDQLVRPGDRVVDIGAYRGVYTVRLSRRVGSTGRVWSIEPFPPNVEALARVVGRRGNVILCPGAASDHAGRQVLAVPVYQGRPLGALATLGSPAADTDLVEIDLLTVDGLVASDPGSDVTFIRCDVVGHEAVALAGAERTIQASLPALLVEIEQRHRQDPIQATLDHLLAFGYHGYFVKGRRLVPIGRFDIQIDQLAFLSSAFVPYSMPQGYVHYFLFVRPDADLGDLISP